MPVPADYWGQLKTKERGQQLNLVLRLARVQGAPQEFPRAVHLHTRCGPSCAAMMYLHAGECDAEGADQGGRNFKAYVCDQHTQPWVTAEHSTDFGQYALGFRATHGEHVIPDGALRLSCWRHNGGRDVCLRCGMERTLKLYRVPSWS